MSKKRLLEQLLKNNQAKVIVPETASPLEIDRYNVSLQSIGVNIVVHC